MSQAATPQIVEKYGVKFPMCWGTPGFKRIFVSKRLPQAGTKSGFAGGGGEFHDRIARTFAVTGPSWHGLRWALRSTGRKTAKLRPSLGIAAMS